MHPSSSILAIFSVSLCGAAFAQDTRTVTEPMIPAFCAKLDAQLTSINDGHLQHPCPGGWPICSSLCAN